MATKKKAAKPAKKASHKKAAPAKKPAAKPAKHAAAKKPVAKASKPAGKKPAPKKAAAKHAPVKVAHAKPVAKKQLPKKPLPKAAQEKRPEPAKHSIPMPIKQMPPKPVAPAKPTKVVMPEIKTKTVRKYEPEFTKSVLDTPQNEQNHGPTMRYNDSELGEFRELITKKLDAAKKELTYLQGLITRKDEMGGDNDDARYMTMEDGSMSMEREQLSQMASRQITFIDHLEKAMMRIENKTYGICRVTGKLIDKARLRAVPHATLSIEAKQTMNK
jgi:RNA polymerase-binding transcription factor DksA